jgi:hypothetical protein
VTDISENAHRVAAPVLKARRVIVSQSGIAYWFAVMEQKTVTPGPVDLDEDTHMAKREASSRIYQIPTELIERFARMSAYGPLAGMVAPSKRTGSNAAQSRN